MVLASSLIPGNENAVYRVINGLTRLGANVVHKGNALVHVSGHASAGELLYCYNIVKPRNVMPVHGEVPPPDRQRRPRGRHRRARASGRSSPRTARSSTCATAGPRIVGKVDAGYIFVDGATVGDITEAPLTDRRILGEEGFISVVAVVNTHAVARSSAARTSTPAASSRTTRSSTPSAR